MRPSGAAGLGATSPEMERWVSWAGWEIQSDANYGFYIRLKYRIWAFINDLEIPVSVSAAYVNLTADNSTCVNSSGQIVECVNVVKLPRPNLVVGRGCVNVRVVPERLPAYVGPLAVLERKGVGVNASVLVLEVYRDGVEPLALRLVTDMSIAKTVGAPGNIEGFNSNTSGLYFVDNSQFKIIRKGYNKIRFDKIVEYPNNYITNWDLKNYTVVSPTEGNAFSWEEERFVDGIIYVKSYPEKRYNSFIMEYSLSNPYTALVRPINLPKVNTSDVLTLKMDVAGLGVPASGPDALFILKILVDDGVDSVFLDDNKQWVNSTFNNHFYYFPFDSTDPKVNLDLVMPLLPIGGDLSIELILCDTAAPYWKSTVGSIEASNFQLTVETYFKQVTTESFITDSNEYVLEIDLPLGFNG